MVTCIGYGTESWKPAQDCECLACGNWRWAIYKRDLGRPVATCLGCGEPYRVEKSACECAGAELLRTTYELMPPPRQKVEGWGVPVMVGGEEIRVSFGHHDTAHDHGVDCACWDCCGPVFEQTATSRLDAWVGTAWEAVDDAICGLLPAVGA